MTLKDFLVKHGRNATAKKYGIAETNLTRWANDGALAVTKGKELLAIRRPEKALWESQN